MNSINNSIDEFCLNIKNNTLNNNESFFSESKQRFPIEETNNLNLELRKISKNPGNRRQKINLKTESCSQTSQDKRFTFKIKHKLTPFQMFMKQKEQIKILNNIKFIGRNSYLKGISNISNKKKNKNLNLINYSYLTSYKSEDNSLDNSNFRHINNRFTPKEYFSKIKTYKNNVMNYNTIKFDLYNYSLNQRMNNKITIKYLKSLHTNNNINNRSDINKKIKTFSTKNKSIKKSIVSKRNLINADNYSTNCKEKTEYNNRNYFNRSKLILFDYNKMTIPKKKKYNIKISLSNNKTKYLDFRVDTINNSGNNIKK